MEQIITNFKYNNSSMNENIRKLCAGGIFCLWGTVTLFAQDTARTNLELDYETDNRTVAMREVTYQSDKTRTIKGVILDAKTQEPLIGASVMDVHNQKGTVTDLEGQFTLVVNENTKKLEISFIGYKTSSIKLDNRNTLRILLDEDSQLLDEVVVTGIQTIEKGRATGAYNIVNQEDMKNIYSTSLSEKLEGAVPGLYLDKDNNMTIRGLSTLNANTKPLIVVDGFPLESSELNLNPNDIAQVTVLKDAASASIWGIRAANGVIVITTKRGDKGRVSVNYSGTLTSSGAVDWDDLHILSSDQYVKARFESILDQGISGAAYNGLNELEKIYSQYNQGNITLDNAWSQVNELGRFNNAKQITDNFYRHAFTQQHNVSLSTGGERSSTYLSFSYDQSKTHEVGNEYNKFNLLVNNDFKLHRTFTVAVGLRGTYRNSKNNSIDMTGYEPWQRILNDDGSYYNEYNGVSEEWASDCLALGMRDWHKNTLEMMRMNDNRTKDYNLSTTLKLNWTPIEGLEISSQGSYEFGHIQGTQFYSEEHYTTRDLTNRFTEVEVVDGHPVAILENHLPTSGGIKNLNDTHLYSYSIRNMISYTDSFKDFNYKVMAGNEIYSLEGNNYSNWLWGFDPDLLTSQSINLATLQSGVYGYNGRTQNLDESYSPTYTETLNDTFPILEQQILATKIDTMYLPAFVSTKQIY